MGAKTIFGADILFGVDLPRHRSAYDLPDNVVSWKVRCGPEDFPTIVLVRRDGDTLFTEKWFLRKRKDEKIEPHILAAEGGRYNAKYQDIMRAAFVHDIKRGSFPLNVPILAFVDGKWTSVLIEHDKENDIHWISAVLPLGLQSTPVDITLQSLNISPDDLPWVQLPMPVES